MKNKRSTLQFAKALFFILAGLLLAISISRLIYPYDAGHYEAVIFTPADLIAKGQNPYGFATSPPFVAAPYGYVYYALISVGLHAFGSQLWFGRAISILAACVCFACLGRITFSLTQSRRTVFLSLIAFASSFTVQTWTALQRPDFPALALALIALLLVFESGDKPDKVTIRSYFIVILLAAAFLSKQTILLPVIVAAARYFQLGKCRPALFTLAGTTFICATVMFLLNVTSGGGYVWQHFVLMQNIPHSYLASIHMVVTLLKAPSTWIFLVVTLAFLGQKVVLGKRRISSRLHHNFLGEMLSQSFRSPALLVVSYFIIAVGLAFVTSARAGSNINYYLEATVAASIVVALAFSHLHMGIKRRNLYSLVLLLFTLTGSVQFIRVARGEYFRWVSLPYYDEIVATLERSVPPQSICISVYPELVVAAGREYHFGDWIQYNDGRSEELQKLFQEAIASRRYSAIIWTAETSFAGYHLVHMNNPPPSRFYPVWLYIRDL